MASASIGGGGGINQTVDQDDDEASLNKKLLAANDSTDTDGNGLGTSGRESLYVSRCDVSLISNYFLYLIFITNTVFYIYFAVRKSIPCYANYLSDSRVYPENGRNIYANFQYVFVIGSICGILEVLRNSINLWAKCFNY